MKNKKLLYGCMALLFLCSGLSGFLLSFYLHKPTHSDPIEKSAEVNPTFHSPLTFVNQLQGDKNAGKKIFNEFCTVCHGKNPSIPMIAPRIGDKKQWQALRRQGKTTLLKITIDGRGAMPARGGCFECSDAQLMETIEYMLIESN